MFWFLILVLYLCLICAISTRSIRNFNYLKRKNISFCKSRPPIKTNKQRNSLTTKKNISQTKHNWLFELDL